MVFAQKGQRSIFALTNEEYRTTHFLPIVNCNGNWSAMRMTMRIIMFAGDCAFVGYPECTE
jgi:hypothetical protein